MRKALPLIALAVVLALAAPASAKEGVVLSSTPNGIVPGQDWDVRITPFFHDSGSGPPSGPKGIAIRERGTSRTFRFRAHRVNDEGYKGTLPEYEATVRFPHEGLWTYRVTGFGLADQQFDPVYISKPDPAPTPAAAHSGGGDDGFPLAAVLGGLGGAALLVVGVLASRRRWPGAWRAEPPR